MVSGPRPGYTKRPKIYAPALNVQEIDNLSLSHEKNSLHKTIQEVAYRPNVETWTKIENGNTLSYSPHSQSRVVHHSGHHQHIKRF